MIIRIDTREQAPLVFSQWCPSLVGTVPFYDYALDGDQESFAVERKSLEDFIGSVVMQDRWQRELAKRARAREAGMTTVYYVLEAKFSELATFDYARFSSGRVHLGLLYRRWRELAVHHDTHIVWAEDPAHAAHAVYLILKSRNEQIQKGKTQKEDKPCPTHTTNTDQVA